MCCLLFRHQNDRPAERTEDEHLLFNRKPSFLHRENERGIVQYRARMVETMRFVDIKLVSKKVFEASC